MRSCTRLSASVLFPTFPGWYRRSCFRSEVYRWFVRVLTHSCPWSPGFLSGFTFDLQSFRVQRTSLMKLSKFNGKSTSCFLFFFSGTYWTGVSLKLAECYSLASLFDLNKGWTPSPLTFYLKLFSTILPFPFMFLSKFDIQIITNLSSAPVAK